MHTSVNPAHPSTLLPLITSPLIASPRIGSSHSALHLPLVQIFSLERSKADADLMELTAKHELALASKMAKLGMTR